MIPNHYFKRNWNLCNRNKFIGLSNKFNYFKSNENGNGSNENYYTVNNF